MQALIVRAALWAGTTIGTLTSASWAFWSSKFKLRFAAAQDKHVRQNVDSVQPADSFLVSPPSRVEGPMGLAELLEMDVKGNG